MPQGARRSDLPHGARWPMDLEEVALSQEARLATMPEDLFRPISTGFPQLDAVMGGGLHGGDLMLLGGVQNIGKTAQMLQLVGNIAEDPNTLNIVVCFEHATQALLERMIIQHSFVGEGQPHITADLLNGAYRQVIHERVIDPGAAGSFVPEVKRAAARPTSVAGQIDPMRAPNEWSKVLSRVPEGLATWNRVMQKMRNVWLVMGHSVNTDPQVLSFYVQMGRDMGYQRIVLYVDYIQRVPVYLAGRTTISPMERVEYVARSLKSMALEAVNDGYVLAVAAVAAADEEGLRNGRVHLENLFGPMTMQYEPDVAWIINKDLLKLDGYNTVRLGVEKNRHGPTDVEFRLKHYGAAFRFSLTGEQIKDAESWQNERKEEKDPMGIRLLTRAVLAAQQAGGVPFAEG